MMDCFMDSEHFKIFTFIRFPLWKVLFYQAHFVLGPLRMGHTEYKPLNVENIFLILNLGRGYLIETIR